MKVLLHQDVPRLGYLGDVVDVNDGYARNYLLPQHVAVEPTKKNIEDIAEERARQAEIRRLAFEQMKKVAEKAEGTMVTIEARTNEQGHLFGSVSEAMIAESLQSSGHEVQAKAVRLEGHPRQVGQFPVRLHFAEDIEATITVEITSITDEKEHGGSEEEHSEESPQEQS